MNRWNGSKRAAAGHLALVALVAISSCETNPNSGPGVDSGLKGVVETQKSFLAGSWRVTVETGVDFDPTRDEYRPPLVTTVLFEFVKSHAKRPGAQPLPLDWIPTDATVVELRGGNEVWHEIRLSGDGREYRESVSDLWFVGTLACGNHAPKHSADSFPKRQALTQDHGCRDWRTVCVLSNLPEPPAKLVAEYEAVGTRPFDVSDR